MQPGERHGRYELVRLLGEGGMGRVWEALLHGPGGFRKRVALKVLKQGGAGLAREARLGGLLRHRNLVETYALEEIDGTWVCAMELIEGGAITPHLPLPPSAVLEVGRQVCAGLTHAHREIGLVHLDLKPDNVLVDRGVVKVADLGIARARGQATQPNLLGTPAYMAPEQAAGQTLDARADVFSTGVLLIALATGSHGRDPRRVPWLEDVLARCLAEDREQRFRSMAELGEALASVDVDGPTLAEALGQEAVGGLASGLTSGSTVQADTFRLEPEAPAATNLAEEEPDAFVGRTEELAALVAALETSGLVTLKGLGGLGKTRLARRAARTWHQRSGGAAWFVDLSTARSALAVVDAVGATLGIPLTGDGVEARAEAVGHAVRSRGPIAVVLDNFEQVLDAAPVVQRWREQAPEARWLVTTREVLRLPGERVTALGPLAEVDARTLLRVRGEASGATVPDDEDLAELARRLDGIPLALELAAGRLGLMGAGRILARLDQRFRLLRGQRADLPARQATLRGALDWSWELCGPEERSALAQLSVFEGGCTVEAAEAVLSLPDGAWALDILEDLEGRSLIGFREGRLHLYESVRAYAAEKLGSDPDLEARHGAWYAALGDRSATESLHGRGGQARFDGLRTERPNLVVALERAVARGDAEVAVGCAAAAWEVFERMGPLAVGLGLLEQVGGQELDAEQRGRVEGMLGLACKVADRPEESLKHLETARRIFGPHGEAPDRVREGRALLWMAGLQEHAERADEAKAQLEEALAIARETGDRRGEALAHANRSNLLRFGGRLDDALEEGLVALRILREVGDRRAVLRTLVNLGHLYDGLGRFVESRATMEAALEAARTLGDRRMEGLVLGHLATQADVRGEPSLAMHRASVRLAREVGSRRSEGVGLSNLALCLAREGDFDGSVAAFEEAIAALEDAGGRRWVGFALGNLGHVMLAAERWGEAEDPLLRATDIARELDDQYGEGCWRAGLGALYAHQGELARSGKEFEAAIELLQAGGHRHQLAKTAVMQATAARDQGDHETARRATARVRAFMEAGGAGHDAELDKGFAELDAAYPA